MNKSKKLTAAVAASAVASALVAPAAYADNHLTDIDGSYAKDAILELVEKGVINGKGDGTFDPTGKIERQDFAIILAKALGLDVSSAPATATFSDVPTTHYAFKYVEAAAKAGLIKGTGEGQFGLGANLSRQDMAVLFVRALGEDVTGKGAGLKFSDAGEIADYAKDAVAAAVELGLVSGNPDGTFNPTGNAERQAVALVASKFLKVAESKATAKLTGAAVVDTNTVTLTFSKELEKLEAGDVAVKAKATGAAVNVSTVTLGADKKSATVKTASALASGTTYTVTVGSATVEFTTAAKPEVSAVTALNLKQVKVEFSGEVDKTAVEDVANYTFTGASTPTAGTASLQADGKTVIVTLAGGSEFNQQGAYKLGTKNLKAKDATAVADASKDFTAFDNAVPTAKEVVVTGPNSLKVTFSAPIETVAYTDFALDSGSVSVSNPQAGIADTEYSVTLNVGADLAEGTHTLKVAGPVGFNGLKVAEQTLSFNFAKDTVAPTVSVDSAKLETTNSSKVVLKFSEPVNLNTTSTAKLFAIYNGLNAATTATPSADAKMVNQNGVNYYDKYDVVFPVVFPTGTVNIFVNNFNNDVSSAKIKDTWGNAFTDAVVTATINVDNVKPTVAVVKADTQQTVTVEFSENVDTATAQDPNNYVFLKEDGSVLTGTGLGLDGAGHPTSLPSYDPATKKVTIDNLNLAGGVYKLKIANVKDLAIPAQNKMDEATVTFTVTDKSAPIVNSALFTADQKALFIYFSKSMDAASITDLNNYEVANIVLSNLPAGITATATAINNNKAVKITFSAAWTALTANAPFNYGRLKDSMGNYTAGLNNNLGSGIQADGIADSDIKNVKIVAADTITFEVEQSLSGIDLTRFTFQGAAVGQAFYVNQKVTSGNDGALVTVKLPVNSANKLYSDISNFTGLSILAAFGPNTSALLNANGNGLKADVVVSSATDAVAATVTAVSTQNLVTGTPETDRAIDAIHVTFSEAMLASSVGLDSFTVAGYTVTDVQALNLTGNTASQFRVVLKENSWNDLANLPTVTLAKDAKDAAGNVTKASSTLPSTVKGF